MLYGFSFVCILYWNFTCTSLYKSITVARLQPTSFTFPSFPIKPPVPPTPPLKVESYVYWQSDGSQSTSFIPSRNKAMELKSRGEIQRQQWLVHRPSFQEIDWQQVSQSAIISPSHEFCLWANKTI